MADDKTPKAPAPEIDAAPVRADETIPGGRYINASGFYINANGQFIDANGTLVDSPVKAKA